MASPTEYPLDSVMRLAAQETQRFNHDTTDTGHVLIAITCTQHQILNKTLAKHGIDTPACRKTLDIVSPQVHHSVAVTTIGEYNRSKHVEQLLEQPTQSFGKLGKMGGLLLALIELRDEKIQDVMNHLGVDVDELCRDIRSFGGGDESA